MSFLCLSARHLIQNLLRGADTQHLSPYQEAPRENAACVTAPWFQAEGKGTYGHRGAGCICSIARGGERSQGPAASVSPREKVRD